MKTDIPAIFSSLIPKLARGVLFGLMAVGPFAPRLLAGTPAKPGTPLVVTVNLGVSHAEKEIDARLEVLKSLGVTSIQTYIYWNKVEKTPGVLDWSEYDAEVALFRKHGLKWVPFVIISPWYVTPEFVRQDPRITMFRCLEHGRESLIPSIWSPRLQEYVREYLSRFAGHYGPMGVLESVNLGISGDYGEAIYSVIGNWPGAYHSHAGYWCGDKLAEEDFRRHLQAAYPAGIDALNEAWKSRYASFDEVKPFHPAKAPSERAWQEFLAWYRGAMTDYSDFCLRTAREIFPDTDLYLSTGGDMAPEHGSDFSAQAQVAAKHRAGLRITNEASSFPMNVRYTRLVATACRHYGAYFGHEPASVVTAAGAVGRIFNAITSGANQLLVYHMDLVADSNPPAPGESGLHLKRFRDAMNLAHPVIDTAVYHANLASQQVLSGEVSRLATANFGELLSELRRFIDYDLMDDRLIQDDALEGKSILLVAGANVMPRDTIARIADWVRKGGVLFVLASRPVDWDGSTAPFDALIGLTPDTDEIEGIATDGPHFPRPESLPSITSLKDVWLTRAYTNLAAGSEILLAMKYAPAAGVAWRRKIGDGIVYTFFGPMAMKQAEDTWMVAQRLPLRFMRDSFQVCIREGLLPHTPPTMNLDLPDFYKVLTDSGLWLLNMGAEPRSLVHDGTTFTVPPLDILHLNLTTSGSN